MRVVANPLFNFQRLFLGSAVLMLGSLVYLFDRPVAGLPYLPEYFPGLPQWPDWLSAVGGILPAFAHPLGFSLLSLSVINANKLGLIAVCGFWGAVNLAVEFLQQPHFSSFHQWLLDSGDAAGGSLARLGCLLQGGHYDPADMLAILFATVVAEGIGWRTTDSGGRR